MIFLPVALLASAAAAPALEGPAPVPASPTVAEPSSLQDEAADENPQGWSGSVTLGASTSSGNNDTTAASASAEAQYVNDPGRLNLAFSWLYNETQDVVTQRRTQLSAQYDHFFNDELYGYVKGGAMKDFQANIDRRYDIGAGLGYQFLKDATWDVSGEAGVSYFDEQYIPSGNNGYMAARLAYNVEYDSGSHWTLGHKGELFPSLENSDEGYMNFDTRFKTQLTEKMFAQFQWLLNYNRSPAPGTKKEDNIFLLTIGWSF